MKINSLKWLLIVNCWNFLISFQKHSIFEIQNQYFVSTWYASVKLVANLLIMKLLWTKEDETRTIQHFHQLLLWYLEVLLYSKSQSQHGYYPREEKMTSIEIFQCVLCEIFCVICQYIWMKSRLSWHMYCYRMPDMHKTMEMRKDIIHKIFAKKLKLKNKNFPNLWYMLGKTYWYWCYYSMNCPWV